MFLHLVEGFITVWDTVTNGFLLIGLGALFLILLLKRPQKAKFSELALLPGEQILFEDRPRGLWNYVRTVRPSVDRSRCIRITNRRIIITEPNSFGILRFFTAEGQKLLGEEVVSTLLCFPHPDLARDVAWMRAQKNADEYSKNIYQIEMTDEIRREWEGDLLSLRILITDAPGTVLGPEGVLHSSISIGTEQARRYVAVMTDGVDALRCGGVA